MNVVIAGNLVENGLVQRDVRGLAFDHQKRLPGPVEHHQIGSFLGLIQHQTTLTLHQCSGVLVVAQQQVNHVLTNPLFGSKPDILSAEYIENMGLPANLTNFIPKRGQVERIH